LATRLVRSLFYSTFLSAFLIRLSLIITPIGLLSLNKHLVLKGISLFSHAKHSGIGFFWDVSLTSNPALFKRLVRAKVFLYEPLVVLELSLMACSAKSILKVLPLIVVLAFSKGLLSPSCSSFTTLQYLEDLNSAGYLT
jgi:hypothetical protein